MARFRNVAAGIDLTATGDAAEMMRLSPAYVEIEESNAQGAEKQGKNGVFDGEREAKGDSSPAKKQAKNRVKTP